MILHCITPITLSNFWLKACDITIKSFYYLLSMDISSHFHIYSLTMFLQISFWYNISYFYIPLVKSNNLYMNMSVFIMKFLHSKLFTYNIIHVLSNISDEYASTKDEEMILFPLSGWTKVAMNDFYVTIDTCELWYNSNSIHIYLMLVHFKFIVK